MSKTIKIERPFETEYIVNFNTGIGKPIPYKWAGSKKGKPNVISIPQEVFDYIDFYSKAFKRGELRVYKEQENVEEIEQSMASIEENKTNSMSRDEIVTLLKGNINKMKSVLGKIDSKSTMQFVKQIADELDDSDEGLNSTKIKFVNEWIKPKTDDTE